MKKHKLLGIIFAAVTAFSAAVYAPANLPTLSVQVSAASKLAAPANITYSVAETTVKLKWSKVKGADAYRVFRYNNSTKKYESIKTVKKTTASINELKAGTYKLRIAALVKKNGKYSVQTKSSPITIKITAAEENMTDRITVNTQSSIRIESQELIIRIDPFRISDEPHDADIIFITHAHYDHFSPDDIKKVIKSDTVVVAPSSMKKLLADEGLKDAVLLSPDESSEVRGISVETVRSYNQSKSFHPKSNNWLGYILTVDGKRIYAAGDTDATREAKSVSCDIAMVPIGGTYTMDVKEAAELINAIKPETVIPIHYGSIVGSRSDADKFARLVDKSINVVTKI